MRTRHTRSLLRLGMMLACVSLLAACTKGGQFDPTTLLDSDMFDNKKPLTGQREPVFPAGVPGASTGIPPDLYKGYQPPPDDTASGTATPLTPPVAEADQPVERPKPKAKPKPKPKPKLARAPESPRTEISVGLSKKPKPAADRQAGSAPPSSAQQSVWPAPPPTNSAASQTAWPAPPPTGGSQQAAQPSQSIWPNPPPTSGQ
jgi:outer membrane biosynthesis protein TonB